MGGTQWPLGWRETPVEMRCPPRALQMDRMIDHTMEHSQHPDNGPRNRYVNVLPYDHNRVVLQTPQPAQQGQQQDAESISARDFGLAAPGRPQGRTPSALLSSITPTGYINASFVQLPPDAAGTSTSGSGAGAPGFSYIATQVRSGAPRWHGPRALGGIRRGSVMLGHGLLLLGC